METADKWSWNFNAIPLEFFGTDGDTDFVTVKILVHRIQHKAALFQYLTIKYHLYFLPQKHNMRS